MTDHFQPTGELSVMTIGARASVPLAAVAGLCLATAACEAVDDREDDQAMEAREGEALPEPDELQPVNCGGDLTPPVVTLEWQEVASPTSVAEVASGELHAILTNQRDEALTLSGLRLMVDAGGRKIERELGDLTLTGGEQRTITVPIASFGVDIAKLDLSGALALHAEVVHPTLGVVEQADAPATFFHQDPQTSEVLVYGAKALRSQFGAGDFSGNFAADGAADGAVRQVMRHSPSTEETK